MILNTGNFYNAGERRGIARVLPSSGQGRKGLLHSHRVGVQVTMLSAPTTTEDMGIEIQVVL